MNFEKRGMNRESLIRKVSRTRFFDSLSCNVGCSFLFHNTTLQLEISKVVYNSLASLKRKALHDFTPFYTVLYPTRSSHLVVTG
jgi:hypothetical protein